MLTDRRTVLSAGASPGCKATVLRVGTAGVVDACWARTGRAVLEGVLSFEGVVGAEGRRDVGEGRLLRVLGVGSGGRAEVGGSLGGPSDLGSIVFIVA